MIVNVHQWNGRPVHLPPPSLIITTDAAKKGGWGASCNKYKTLDRSSKEEASLHINILELKAALFALKSFANVYQMTNAHVRLKIDNTSAQAYISHQGGTKSVCLCNQAQEVWKWCLLHQTIVSAEHLPGIHNWDADQVSRIFNDRTEWMIRPHLLRETLSLLAVKPSIDLLASCLNKQFSNLLQLETRSRSMEDRCLQFLMDTEGPLCFPTILPGEEKFWQKSYKTSLRT